MFIIKTVRTAVMLKKHASCLTEREDSLHCPSYVLHFDEN
jgi:hypothetical protein